MYNARYLVNMAIVNVKGLSSAAECRLSSRLDESVQVATPTYSVVLFEEDIQCGVSKK